MSAANAPERAGTMPDHTLSRPKNDRFAFTRLTTVALAAAVVTGASLGGLASGAVPDLLHFTRSGHDSEILAEQRRQASALEKIEISVSRARADGALLDARVDEAENLSHEAANSVAGIDHEFDLRALRSSFDEQAERNRNEWRAVNKRLDWLEKLVYGQDSASSVQPAALGRRAAVRPGWYVLHAEKGVAVIAGKGGAIDVTPGFVIPNLGRVAAIRQAGGRWVVTTDKGMTIRER